eukprot:g7849.t1
MVSMVILVVLSIVFIVAGIVVSSQWPQPNFCCWTQPMNDRIASSCCCSLYQANISLAVIWLMLFVFMLLSHVWQLIVLSAALVVLHSLTAAALHRQFQRVGWPTTNLSAAYPPQVAIVGQLGAQGEGNILCAPNQPIPFVTAYIGRSPDSVTLGYMTNTDQVSASRTNANPTGQIF